MDKKMIETAKKYGTDSFEYFKAGCDIFNREELLERLFETTKEVIELQKRNNKAIELLKSEGCYEEDTKTFNSDIIYYDLDKFLNILQGDDGDETNNNN